MGDVAVLFLRGPGLVENGGIIAAVKRHIRLDEEMVGEHLAAVAHQDFQHTPGGGSSVPPRHPVLQHRREGERDGDEQEEQDDGQRPSHAVTALRRNTSHVAKRNRDTYTPA